MAPHADRLAAIGRDGFTLLDKSNCGGTWVQARKSQYNGPQQHAFVPSDENVIDSKKAAERYKGVVITEYKKKKFFGRRF